MSGGNTVIVFFMSNCISVRIHNFVEIKFNTLVIFFNSSKKSNEMATAMDVDSEEIEMPTSSSSKGEKKRFEVKKVVQHNLS